MYGLYKVQAGLEAEAGTAVAADHKWMANLLHPKVGDQQWIQPEEERGSLAGAFRAYFAQRMAELGSLVGDVTFEDLPIWLGMAIVGSVSPTQPDSAESPDTYLWTYAPSLTSGNTPDTYTIEWGDDVQVWESEYAFATDLEISGSLGEAWKISMPIVGRQHSTASFTGALSDRTVESVLTNISKLYMDDAGGSIGTTQIESAFRDFSWKMGEHFAPFFTAEGNKYFTMFSEKKFGLGSPTLDITLVVDATTKTLITTKYAAGTVQLVRIEGTGTSIEDAYTRYVYLDGAYLITGVDEIAEANGESVVTLHLAGQYDSTYAKLFEIAVMNKVDALPS